MKFYMNIKHLLQTFKCDFVIFLIILIDGFINKTEKLKKKIKPSSNLHHIKTKHHNSMTETGFTFLCGAL